MMIGIIICAVIITINIQLTLGQTQISETTKCTSSQLTSCAYSQIRCPPNYYFNGQYCLPLQAAPTQQPDTATSATATKCFNQAQRTPSTVSPTNPDPLPVKPVCEPFYDWNGRECYKVLSNEPICPFGHNLTADGQCVSSVQALCQENYYINGDFCVALLETQVLCPDNYYWDGTKCLYQIIPSCPEGFVLNNGYCEVFEAGSCQSGTFMDNFKCIGHHQVEIQCDFGYTWDGLNCVNSTNSCEDGFELRGNSCEKYIVKMPDFACPPRTQMVGNQCVSYEQICPKGFALIDSVCVEQITSTNQTETFIAPNCTAGYQLVGCECVQINETSRPPIPICPPNYVYKDGLCYYEQGHYPPVCPTNYEIRNGICVPLRPDSSAEVPNQNCTQTDCQKNYTSACSCPAGYTLNNNGLCILTGHASKVCPSGYELINEKCILTTQPSTCPPGYHFSNGSCLQPVHIVPPCEVVCPLNTELENGVCVITTDIGTGNCPPGYRRIDGNCVPLINPEVNPCPTGYLWNNGICEPEIPCVDRCPPGYNWINGTCMNFATKVPNQPDGTDENITDPPALPPVVPPSLPPIIPALPPIIQPCPPINQNTSCQPCPSNPPCQNCPPNNTPCQPCPPCNTPQPCGTSDQMNPPTSAQPNSGCSNCPQTTHYITKDGHISITNIVNVAHHHHQRPPPTQNHILASENIDESFDYDTTSRKDTDNDDTTKKCCEITTPRQCKRTGDEWTCYHKKYQRCGDICTQPKIYLKPKMIHYQSPILIMPPPPRRIYGRRRMFSSGAVDCSGCIPGGYRCSVECYSYPDCRQPDCAFIDQDSYCEEWGHYETEGCSADDGYFK